VAGVWKELTDNVTCWRGTSPIKCATSRWSPPRWLGGPLAEDHRYRQGEILELKEPSTR